MRKIAVFCSLVLLMSLAAPQAGAQEKSDKAYAAAAPAGPVHYYHFDFVVEDLDSAGKVVNSRSYSTTVDTEPHYLTSLRAGSRVPVITGTGGINTQFQYIDLGVELDIRDVHEVGQRLAFDLTANLSGESSPANGSLHEPVIRQNKWASKVLIPIGKRATVFASDSLDNKGSTRVAVTATPLEQ